MNNNRLENTRRRGFLRSKYGINSNGKASSPSKAVGLRNSISLFEQADRRQRGEDEITEIAIGDVERVVNSALVAEAADFQVMMRQFRLIVAPCVTAPLVANFPLGFAIDQRQTAVREGGLDFWARQDLNRGDIEIERAQQIESRLVGSGGHEKIRNQDGLAWAAQVLQMLAEGGGQVE